MCVTHEHVPLRGSILSIRGCPLLFHFKLLQKTSIPFLLSTEIHIVIFQELPLVSVLGHSDPTRSTDGSANNTTEVFVDTVNPSRYRSSLCSPTHQRPFHHYLRPSPVVPPSNVTSPPKFPYCHLINPIWNIVLFPRRLSSVCGAPKPGEPIFQHILSVAASDPFSGNSNDGSQHFPLQTSYHALPCSRHGPR